MIKGKEFAIKVKPPLCTEMLRPSKEQRLKWLGLEVTRGKTIVVHGQQFIGYTLCPQSIEEVDMAYVKIKYIHGDARHVVCAFRLPGRNY